MGICAGAAFCLPQLSTRRIQTFQLLPPGNKSKLGTGRGAILKDQTQVMVKNHLRNRNKSRHHSLPRRKMNPTKNYVLMRASNMLSAARTYGLSNLLRHIGADGISKDAILVRDFYITFAYSLHLFSPQYR